LCYKTKECSDLDGFALNMFNHYRVMQDGIRTRPISSARIHC
jgi:hypothetical protein